MFANKHRLVLLGLIIVMMALALSFASASTLDAAAPPAQGHRFILVAKSDGDYNALREEALKAGGKILREMSAVKMLVVAAPANFKDALKSSTHVEGVVPDRIERLIRPEMQAEFFGTTELRKRINLGTPQGLNKPAVKPDPAFNLPGLLWNVLRINAPEAWKLSTGSPLVTVGVADTGLDYTHSELKTQVANVVDFTGTEDPPICKTYFALPSPPFPSPSMGDADLAAFFHGPANTDWNGHGSWIGGNIAAALDGVGINGIAPNIKLVSLKISQWCGSAYDSEIIDAFLYAADHGINIVSISFGGYLDLKDPAQKLIYQQYVKTVAYALSKGTVIVAAAGNEHVRIGAGGLVMSHGPLTTPGSAFVDYYGLYENPGGIPGVVDVAATGNVVNAPSATCPDGTTGSNATCKPTSDAHQPIGVSKKNQLAYYSNYGPRIDVAAPGGARKFNLPLWDRGGTSGYPVTTADGFNAWEDFSITSNWAMEIPCYYWTDPSAYPYFYLNECYSTIQGTSMATPHASAALALIASRVPAARHNPLLLIGLLKINAQNIRGNTTPPLSATDTSAADLTGIVCADGYCHLGGPAISDRDAYGTGLVNAAGLLQ